MTMLEATRSVVGGIDTHGEVHVAAVLDEVGGLLGTSSFSADASGYEALVRWLESFGSVSTVGVEGTGSYGAGISRFLALSGIVVVEVEDLRIARGRPTP
jgi:transposase